MMKSTNVRLICFLLFSVSLFNIFGQKKEDSYMLKFGSIPDIHLGDDIARTRTNKKQTSKPSEIFAVMKEVGCSHVLLSGDWAGGHWEQKEWVEMYGKEPKKRIFNICSIIHGNIKTLTRDNNLTPIVCPGDHEYGDNPWPTGSERSKEFVYYRQAFANEFDIPNTYKGQIGKSPARPLGTQYENTSFATKVENVLFVSIDIFNFGGADAKLGRNGTVDCELTDDQAEWLDKLLAESRKDKSIKFIVVQSHCPISTPHFIKGSSGNTVKGGQTSSLWKIMKKYGVDVYIAGEVHSVTITEEPESKLVEFVHGLGHYAIWESYANKLVAKLYEKGTPENKSCGEMVIDKTAKEKVLTYTGDMKPIKKEELLVHYPLDEKNHKSRVRNNARSASRLLFSNNEGVNHGEPHIGLASFEFRASDSLVVYSDDALYYQNDAIVDAFSRTVGVWVKTTTQAGGIAVTGPNIKTGLNIYINNGKLVVGAKDKSYVVATDAIVNDGNWHLIVATYRDNVAEKNNIDIYVDGRKVVADYSNYKKIVESLRTKITLGGNRSESTGDFDYYNKKSGEEVKKQIVKSDLFTGLIDDFSLWFGALSAEQIALLYNCGITQGVKLSAMQVMELFQSYKQQSTYTVKNQSWIYTNECPKGKAGEIVRQKGVMYLVFDNNGNGMKKQ